MARKLYIFGDSFSFDQGRPSLIQRLFENTILYVQNLSWIQQLSQKYKVKNFSEGGYSNSHIFIKRNIPHLIFWAFPSDYANGSSWTCRDPNDFIYCDEFANEIRPALIYFSRIELDSNITAHESIEYMGNDTRLNHIANTAVHKELFKIVVDVIDGKLSGMIDLKQRLDNVK